MIRRLPFPLRSALAALAALALPSAAVAVPDHVYPQLLAACLDWEGNPGAVMIGCNAVISEGREDRITTAMAYNNRGIAYSNGEMPDQALADYNSAIALNPDYANAYNNRGIAYANRGEFDAAFADFETALRLKPGFMPTLRARAQAYQKSGQYELALAEHNRFVRSSDNLWRSLHERGDLLLAMGRADEALADFNEVIRLHRNDSDAYHQRGRAWRMKGDAARALADFDRAMAVSSDSPAGNTLAGRGWALAVMGRYDEAVAVADRVLKRRPHADLYVTRGFVQLLHGLFAAARSDFDFALLNRPAMADALYGRGLARLKLGDAGGTDDIAAARKILPVIDAQFAAAGLKP